VKRTLLAAVAVCAALGLGSPGGAREVELHVGAGVFSAEADPYVATVQLNCPAERPARVGVGGTFEGVTSARLEVSVNGVVAGTITIDGSAPTYWAETKLPPGESHIQISGKGLGAGVKLQANYIGVVLLDDKDCTVGAVCPELAEVPINCAGLEPFVCELLSTESELYCKQLELDRVALRYQKYPNPTVDIWTPEDRAVYNRLSPQLDALNARQQDLYGRLEELSRKQPRQLKGYLDIHRALETRYQRALAASR
jgi:hypothetical protein